MIVWLTGNSGAGKTTLAEMLCKRHNWIWINLDGNQMRQSISTDMGFSKEDREQHNLRVARLANVLHNQGFNIVVSVIAPFASTRAKIDKLISCKWVYVKRSGLSKPDRPYEEPTGVPVIDTEKYNKEQSYEQLKRAIYDC